MTTEQWWIPLASFASNPLVLLLVGGGMSGILVPYFTRRWQDGQEELKLKADLTKSIGESVTNIIRATEKKLTDRDFSLPEENESWHKACPGIGAEIHTYFHRNKKIPQYWENYKDLVNEFCKLIQEEKNGDRERIIEKINEYISKTNTKTNYEITEKIREILANTGDDNYNIDLEKLRKNIFDMKHELMKYIIESSVAGFSRGFWSYIRRR